MSAAARGAAGWLYRQAIFRRRVERGEVPSEPHLTPVVREPADTPQPVPVTYRKRRVWP